MSNSIENSENIAQRRSNLKRKTDDEFRSNFSQAETLNSLAAFSRVQNVHKFQDIRQQRSAKNYRHQLYLYKVNTYWHKLSRL